MLRKKSLRQLHTIGGWLGREIRLLTLGTRLRKGTKERDRGKPRRQGTHFNRSEWGREGQTACEE